MLGGRIHPAGLPPSPSACPLGVLGVSTALAQPRPRVPAPCPVPGTGQPVVSPSGWVRRWEGWKRVPRGDFAWALPWAELSQDLRWRLGHESGDLAVSPGQGRGAFTQRRPPGDYESCAASCQGREGPSSLLGSGSASTRCLFGFEELAAYPNVLLGAPSAPAWLPRASGWGSQCPAPLQPALSSGEELFPLLSVWLEGMLGVFLAQAPEGFPSLRSQQGGRLHPLHPHPTPAFRSWNCLLDRLGGIWLCCCFKCC